MTTATIARELAKTVEAAAAAKPAKKASAAKPAQKAKAAPRAASAKKTGAKAGTVSARFGLAAFVRPQSGKALQCHTQAVLEFFGLDKGASANKRDLRNVMGDTAVAYHLKATVANFQEKDGMISLSVRGKTVFASRVEAFNDQDKALVKTFLSVMTTGKPDGRWAKDKTFINSFVA